MTEQSAQEPSPITETEIEIDPALFRKVLGHFPTG